MEQDAAAAAGGATGAAAGAPMAADQSAPMDGAPAANEEIINALSDIKGNYLGSDFDFKKLRTVERLIEKRQSGEEELES